jgi:hypothetical protein
LKDGFDNSVFFESPVSHYSNHSAVFKMLLFNKVSQIVSIISTRKRDSFTNCSYQFLGSEKNSCGFEARMAIDVFIHVLEASLQFCNQIFVGGELPELWQNEAFVGSLELLRHWVVVGAGSALTGELVHFQQIFLSLLFWL